MRGLGLGFAKHCCWRMGVALSWSNLTLLWHHILLTVDAFALSFHTLSTTSNYVEFVGDWALPWWGLNKVINCNWACLVNEMRAWMNTLRGLEGLTHIRILNHSSFTTCQNSPWLFTTYIACCFIEVPAYKRKPPLNTVKCQFASLWFLHISLDWNSDRQGQSGSEDQTSQAIAMAALNLQTRSCVSARFRDWN